MKRLSINCDTLLSLIIIRRIINSNYASWRRGHSNQTLKPIPRAESLPLNYGMHVAPQVDVSGSEIGWSWMPKRDRVIAEATKLYVFFLFVCLWIWEVRTQKWMYWEDKWRVSQPRIITFAKCASRMQRNCSLVLEVTLITDMWLDIV